MRFGQPDYFLIVLIGLTSVLALAGDSVVRALSSLLLGMLLATVGVDDVYGTVRFDFGSSILRDGVDYLPVMVGCTTPSGTCWCGSVRGSPATPGRSRTRCARRFLRLRAAAERSGSLARGTALGSVCGVVPGAGATVASFLAYGVEGRVARTGPTSARARPTA